MPQGSKNTEIWTCRLRPHSNFGAQGRRQSVWLQIKSQLCDLRCVLSTVLVVIWLVRPPTLGHPIPTPKKEGERQADRQRQRELDSDTKTEPDRDRERQRETDTHRDDCQCSYGDIMNKDNIKLTDKGRAKDGNSEHPAITFPLQGAALAVKGQHPCSVLNNTAQSRREKKAGRQQWLTSHVCTTSKQRLCTKHTVHTR